MSEGKAGILIVDDDREIRSVLHEFLRRSYDCVSLDSAEEALSLLAAQQFDLIGRDIKMARMSGLEMLSRISTLAPDSVVVMSSGRRTIEFASEAIRAGALDYITKP